VKWRLALVLCLLARVTLLPAVVRAQPVAEPAARPKLTKSPKLIRFVHAEYPQKAKQQKRTASVLLELVIGEKGTVEKASVVTSGGAEFDAPAMRAAEKFLFEPAEVDHKPTRIKIQYRYEFVLEAEVPKYATFSGVVLDRVTKKPFPGVTVSVAGKQAVTDENGRFEVDELPVGKATVSLAGGGLTPIQTEERFTAGKNTAARYELELPAPDASGEGEDMEIVVTAPALKKQVVSEEISAEKAKKVAGTQGDVVRIVENIAGVARASAGSADLVVWGAAPEDTRIYVDGMRIPRLYHSGGLRSVLLTDHVKSVELIPGAYGSEYGRGLGGIVRVNLAPIDDGFHGRIGVDVMEASASVRSKLSRTTAVAVGFRQGYLDKTFDLASDEDVGDLFPIPRYRDAVLRASHRKNDVLVHGGILYSDDRVDRTVASADLAERKRESRRLEFGRVFLGYRQELAGGASVEVFPWLGRDRSELVERFGSTPTSVVVESDVYGFRAGWRGRVERFATLAVGLDGEVTHATVTRSGSVSAPAREGDIRVFGQPPVDQVNADAWKVVSASFAPYGEADIELFDGSLHLIPGLRLEPTLVSVNRRVPVESDRPSTGVYDDELRAEPRFVARLALGPSVGLKAGVGRHHQPPRPEDLSSVFGNPRLGDARADHALFGVEARFSKTIALETTTFYTRSEELVVRSKLSSPLLSEALVNEGKGRTFGAQLMLKKELSARWFGWLAYTLSRSERQRPGERWRLSDYDQTHVLTALAAYDLGKGFELGARMRVASGFPRTPVVGSYYDSGRDAYQPVFGPHNTIRIDTFWQLDVRAAKTWNIGSAKLEAYLDVQNVTDHDNAEEIVYSQDFSEARNITGLPLLPVAGASLTW
jgi:TonB family protein